MSDQPFRFQPALPVTAMQTYSLRTPRSNFRVATCEEYQCPDFVHGWRTTLDERTDQGAALAHYIRTESGRSFVETRDPAGLSVFTFHAGQRCWYASEHRVRIDELPALCLVRDGDWRGNPTGRSRRLSEQDLVDDSGETLERLADKLKEG